MRWNPHAYIVSVKGTTGNGAVFNASFTHCSSKEGIDLADELTDAANHHDYNVDDSGIKNIVIMGVFDCGKNS
jgi:hypothetical protein